MTGRDSLMRPTRSLEGPLPIRDVQRIHAELPGVVFTCDLLVEQRLAGARPGNAEPRHTVDCVDGQAEAVGLVANGQLQRRIVVALLLVASPVILVLMRPVGGEPWYPPPVAAQL